jgi:hypothetical protein
MYINSLKAGVDSYRNHLAKNKLIARPISISRCIFNGLVRTHTNRGLVGERWLGGERSFLARGPTPISPGSTGRQKQRGNACTERQAEGKNESRNDNMHGSTRTPSKPSRKSPTFGRSGSGSNLAHGASSAIDLKSRWWARDYREPAAAGVQVGEPLLEKSIAHLYRTKVRRIPAASAWGRHRT